MILTIQQRDRLMQGWESGEDAMTIALAISKPWKDVGRQLKEFDEERKAAKEAEERAALAAAAKEAGTKARREAAAAKALKQVDARENSLRPLDKPRYGWGTKEEIARVAHLWTIEQWTASKIADEFGVTKNVIIGKISRLGLNKSTMGFKPKAPPTVDLFPGWGKCLFPIGDIKKGGHFCGAPAVFPAPYCADHCAVAYEKKPRASGPRG